jgi:hypothetical protein
MISISKFILLAPLVLAFSLSFVNTSRELSASILSSDLLGDDVAVRLNLPFSFPFYCSNYELAYASTNGLLGFGDPTSAFSNTQIPNEDSPNNFISAFWDDLYATGQVSQIYASYSSEYAAFQWSNMQMCCGGEPPPLFGTFQVWLFFNGTIEFRYCDGFEERNPFMFKLSPSIGIENRAGLLGVKLNFTRPFPFDTNPYFYSIRSGLIF